MQNAIKEAFRKLAVTIVDLVTSKKAIAAALAWVAAIFIKDPPTRDKIVEAIMVYIASQGLVDHARAKADAALGVTTTTATTSTPVGAPSGGVAIAEAGK